MTGRKAGMEMKGKGINGRGKDHFCNFNLVQLVKNFSILGSTLPSLYNYTYRFFMPMFSGLKLNALLVNFLGFKYFGQ